LKILANHITLKESSLTDTNLTRGIST